MQWRGRRQSENVEDRRGTSTGKVVGGIGIGTIITALAVYLLTGNLQQAVQTVQQGSTVETEAAGPSDTSYNPEQDTLAQFCKVVLAETEDVWDKIFSNSNEEYRKPKLVLYSGQIQSACGFGSAATGPFYCPGDEKVYLDLDFFQDLKDRFGAPGDFAMAYVIAHEVGHHIQKQTGVLDEVNNLRSQLSEKEFNKVNVRLELQADFYSGVWAHYINKILDPGDVKEGLGAANAVGDDRLQKQTQGHVVPDAFTHGTSEQRMHWFNLGYETGDLKKGDTFNARSLN